MTLLLIIAIALAIVVFWNKPKHLLFFTILFLPAYQIRFQIFDIPTTALEILVLILFARWLLTTEKTHIKALINEHNKLGIIIGIFLLSATLSMYIAPELRAAAGLWKAYFVEPILFFIVFIDLVRTREDVRKVVAMLGITSLIIALFAIAQFFNIFETPELWLSQGRYTSIFPFPNAVGLFLAPIIPILVAASHTLCEKKESMMLMLTAFLSVIALFLTKTEGAVVALIAAYVVWGIFKSRKTRFMSFIAIAALITLIQTNTFVADKLLFRDWSGQVRTMMWQDTITMLEHHPITGIGLSGFPVAFADYHKHPDIEIFQYPHNIILNFWSETGALGIFAFAAIIIYFFWLLFKQPETQKDTFYHAVAISMIVLLIHGLVDVPYFKNDLSVLFWIIIGLIVASPQLTERQTLVDLTKKIK